MQLEAGDIVGERIVFRAATITRQTREVKMSAKLLQILEKTKLPAGSYLFPRRFGGQLSRQAADLALRQTCEVLGWQGISTHSFRRTEITNLHAAGVLLQQIQACTGHVS